MLLLDFINIFVGFSSLPMSPSQRSNVQPESGVADIVTSVPSAYGPEDGDTLPCPLPMLITNIYSAFLQDTSVTSIKMNTMIMPVTLQAFNIIHSRFASQYLTKWIIACAVLHVNKC